MMVRLLAGSGVGGPLPQLASQFIQQVMPRRAWLLLTRAQEKRCSTSCVEHNYLPLLAHSSKK
jgi:hypothetical protein